jgi:ribosome assembly protein YihI (activator of Der GTPase)
MSKHKSHFTISKEEHLGLLEAQRQLTDILPEIDKAEECGIDCQAYRSQHADALQQITNILKNFGPKSALGIQ